MKCTKCDIDLETEEIIIDNHNMQRCAICGAVVLKSSAEIRAEMERRLLIAGRRWGAGGKAPNLKSLSEDIAILHSTNTGIPDQKGGKL